MKPTSESEGVDVNKTSENLPYPSPNIERDKVEEIRCRARLATAGNWLWTPPEAPNGPSTVWSGEFYDHLIAEVYAPDGECAFNAAFIAHAREDIPYLLARLAVPEKRAEEMERERDEARATTLRACQSYSDQVAEIASERDSLRSSLMRALEGLRVIADGIPGPRLFATDLYSALQASGDG